MGENVVLGYRTMSGSSHAKEEADIMNMVGKHCLATGHKRTLIAVAY